MKAPGIKLHLDNLSHEQKDLIIRDLCGRCEAIVAASNELIKHIGDKAPEPPASILNDWTKCVNSIQEIGRQEIVEIVTKRRTTTKRRRWMW